MNYPSKCLDVVDEKQREILFKKKKKNRESNKP